MTVTGWGVDLTRRFQKKCYELGNQNFKTYGNVRDRPLGTWKVKIGKISWHEPKLSETSNSESTSPCPKPTTSINDMIASCDDCMFQLLGGYFKFTSVNITTYFFKKHNWEEKLGKTLTTLNNVNLKSQTRMILGISVHKWFLRG